MQQCSNIAGALQQCSWQLSPGLDFTTFLCSLSCFALTHSAQRPHILNVAQCSNVAGSTMFCRCTAAPYPQAPQLPHSFTFIPRHTPATSCTCSRMHQKKRYMNTPYTIQNRQGYTQKKTHTRDQLHLPLHAPKKLHKYTIHDTIKDTRIHTNKTHIRDCTCSPCMHQKRYMIHDYMIHDIRIHETQYKKKLHEYTIHKKDTWA